MGFWIENKSNKSQIIFAKEIVINFRFLLVTLGITLIFFIIYNFIFNPAKLGDNTTEGVGGLTYKPTRKEINARALEEIKIKKSKAIDQQAIIPSYAEYDTPTLADFRRQEVGSVQDVDNQPQPDPVEEFYNMANNMPIIFDKQSYAENIYRAINYDAAQASGLIPGYSFGDYGESKYDKPILKSYEAENLQDYRKWAFREDITSKSLYCFFLSLSVLVLGRYIYKGINWVNNTYQKSNPNSIPKSDNSPQMNENNNYEEIIVAGIILIVSIIIVILITSNKFS